MSHVHISVPCHRTLEGAFAVALLQLMTALPQCGWACSLDVLVGESLIQRARCRQAHKFLANASATHQLMLDSDIDFEPNDVLMLLAAEKLLIGGMYPLKKISWVAVRQAALNGVPADKLHEYAAEYVINVLAGPGSTLEAIGEVVPVDEVGTGFLLVARETYDRIREAGLGEFAAMGGGPEPKFTYFDCPVVDGRLLSEDYSFCQKAKKAGIQAYAHMGPKLSHIGAYRFTGDVTKHLVPKP